jgi:hypothetical protein
MQRGPRWRLFVLAYLVVTAACSTTIEIIQGRADAGGDDGSSDASTEGNTIGPDGGTVRLGQATIYVPPHALKEPARITIAILSGDPPAPYVAASAFYRFEPAGLTFSVPATVTLPIVLAQASAAIYWSNLGGGYSRLPTHVAGGVAVAQVTHFSTGFFGLEQSGTDGSGEASTDAPTDAGSDAPSDSSDAMGDGADTGTGSCIHPDDAGVATVYTGVALSPSSLAVNAASIFFTNNHTVLRGSSNGCGWTTVYSDKTNTPGSVTLDDKNVYWSEGSLEAYLLKAPLLGSTVATLTGLSGSPSQLVADGTNVYVNLYTAPTSAILQVSVASGSTLTIASPPGVVSGIAVASGFVYWSNWSDPGSIMRVPVGGGSSETVASGQGLIDGIVTDSANIYWTIVAMDAGGGAIVRAPLAAAVEGGTPTTLAAGVSVQRAIATDGLNVYWTDSVYGRVNEVPVGGGSVTMVAGPVETQNLDIAVYGGFVYWPLYTGSVGSIFSAPK